VSYRLSQHDLTHPVDNPSAAAIDVASSLTFTRAAKIFIEARDGFDPPADTPSPNPRIIEHQRPFPEARSLQVLNRFGGAAGQMLVAKMPSRVRGVDTGRVRGEEAIEL